MARTTWLVPTELLTLVADAAASRLEGGDGRAKARRRVDEREAKRARRWAPETQEWPTNEGRTA